MPALGRLAGAPVTAQAASTYPVMVRVLGPITIVGITVGSRDTELLVAVSAGAAAVDPGAGEVALNTAELAAVMHRPVSTLVGDLRRLAAHLAGTGEPGLVVEERSVLILRPGLVCDLGELRRATEAAVALLDAKLGLLAPRADLEQALARIAGRPFGGADEAAPQDARLGWISSAGLADLARAWVVDGAVAGARLARGADDPRRAAACIGAGLRGDPDSPVLRHADDEYPALRSDAPGASEYREGEVIDVPPVI